jgi:hypothetical protein
MNNETVQMAYVARLAWSNEWRIREHAPRKRGLSLRSLATALLRLLS